jgi:hypothetical protein
MAVRMAVFRVASACSDGDRLKRFPTAPTLALVFVFVVANRLFSGRRGRRRVDSKEVKEEEEVEENRGAGL